MSLEQFTAAVVCLAIGWIIGSLIRRDSEDDG